MKYVQRLWLVWLADKEIETNRAILGLKVADRLCGCYCRSNIPVSIAKTKSFPIGKEKGKKEGQGRTVIYRIYTRFCIAPLDVVKIRLQLQIHSLSDPQPTTPSTAPPKATATGAEIGATGRGVVGGPTYKGTLNTLRTIAQQEGLRSLWKGNVPAEMLYVAYGAIQFTTYRSTAQILGYLGSQSQTKIQPNGQRTRSHALPSAVESFVSGAVAGGVATGATYPLDLLRTRFAAQGIERVYASLTSGVLDIVRSEGVSGLFRGWTAAVGQVVPYMGLFFSAYESLRVVNPLVDHLPFGSGDAVAGVMASVVAKTGVFPLDLVRKRLQVQGPTRTRYVHQNIPEYRGVLSAIALILRNQGVRGLYRGLTVSLFKAAPASAITMWTYESSLKFLKATDFAAADAN